MSIRILDRIDLRLKTGGKEYLRLLLSYRALFLSGVILFIPNLLTLPLGNWSLSPGFCNSIMLCTHDTSPWGVVTSVFLYDSWLNIPAYFLILVAYVSPSDYLKSDERRKRARFALVAMLFSAFLANSLWLLAKPATFSWGASGVVYGLWGVLLAFTLGDGMPNQIKSWDIKTWYKNRSEARFAISNLVLFASTALVIVTEPGVFLSSGPGVNVFAHGISFLGGFFVTELYCRVHKHD